MTDNRHETEFDAFQAWQVGRSGKRLRSPEGNLLHYAMGAHEEAGEAAQLVNKHVFSGKPLDPHALDDEIGDALCFLALLADANGSTLSAIARRNVEKLARRAPDGFKTPPLDIALRADEER